MQSPGVSDVHIPQLAQLISRVGNKKKKKGEKKTMGKLAFGEFYDTSDMVVKLAENGDTPPVEDKENYPLYVAPFYGPHAQVHVPPEEPIMIFNEDGESVEYGESTGEGIYEALFVTDETKNDEAEDGMMLFYDALMIDGVDLTEAPFEERFKHLQETLTADQALIGWRKLESFDEFAKFAEECVSNNVAAIRIKKPDSLYGEEMFINLSEESDGNEEIEMAEDKEEKPDDMIFMPDTTKQGE